MRAGEDCWFALHDALLEDGRVDLAVACQKMHEWPLSSQAAFNTCMEHPAVQQVLMTNMLTGEGATLTDEESQRVVDEVTLAMRTSMILAAITVQCDSCTEQLEVTSATDYGFPRHIAGQARGCEWCGQRGWNLRNAFSLLTYMAHIEAGMLHHYAMKRADPKLTATPRGTSF